MADFWLTGADAGRQPWQISNQGGISVKQPASPTYAGAQAGPTGAQAGLTFPAPLVQASPVQTLQTSHGPADETTVSEPLPTTVQACAGGAAAMGATIAEAVDMAVTSHAASFFISCLFMSLLFGRPTVSISP
jgi:hypothetical protein